VPGKTSGGGISEETKWRRINGVMACVARGGINGVCGVAAWASAASWRRIGVISGIGRRSHGVGWRWSGRRRGGVSMWAASKCGENINNGVGGSSSGGVAAAWRIGGACRAAASNGIIGGGQSPASAKKS